MDDIRRAQILQALSLACKGVALVFALLPLWTLLAVRKSGRPRPSWTVARTILVKIIQFYAPFHNVEISKFGPNYRALRSGCNGVWIPPSPHLIVGEVKEWAKLNEIDCIQIPAYWFDRKGSTLSTDARPSPGQKVAYVLHGGGYCLYSAHRSDLPANVPRGIMKHAGPEIWRVFALEYRLTSRPTAKTPSPFPAALIDAIAGYNYLVNQIGVAPEDIVVEGESAGGNLVLALTRYLVENQGRGDVDMPAPPGALVLIYPWCDLGPPPADGSSSAHTNIPSDIIDITTPQFRSLSSNFCGALGDEAASSNRYISPASQSPSMELVSFDHFPRTLIMCGGAEVLRDQARVLYKKMKADMGADLLKYVEFPDAFHAILWFPYIGEPERTEAFRMIVDWIGERC